ncbi:MAG: alpha/beta hydrolase, partial [Gammaproteobacteria bacterium]|nr:alpha/beta hydrolase [Gammaproteobacteria bacterium]
HDAISVIGRSLGSGIATYLAAHREIDKLVLITPFDSVESLAQARYSLYPVSLLLKDKYRSIDWVKKIDSPTLILLAELDFVVPAEHSQRLIEHFLEQLITVKTFKGLGHNNISLLPDYFLELRKFLITE